jgi:hypothetical protein
MIIPVARPQHQRRHHPTPAKLVYLQLYRIEEQHQRQREGCDNLKDVIVEADLDNADAPLAQSESKAQEYQGEGQR